MRFIFFLFISSFGYSQSFFGVKYLDNIIDTTLVAGPENARYSDVWGFGFNAHKYAVLGSTMGSHFIKIENNKLEEIDFKPGAFTGLTVQHRDYKKYKNYIYAVCDEGNSTLQIFDISYLPDSVHKIYDSNTLFTICHNIFIDTVKAKLYACGPDNSGLKVYDLLNPQLPTLVHDVNFIPYVHDCYVRNDTAFLNAGFDGLEVYYFGDAIPKQLGVLDFYPEQGYNHSGWLSKDGSLYCFIDETIGKKIKLCELNEGLENIAISELFGTEDAIDFVPHNINIIKGFAIVSYYNQGFRIFDLLKRPVEEIAFFDTFPIKTNYKLNGAWGVSVFEDKELILISDRQYGLFLFSFPFTAFRNLESGLVVNTPFINTQSLILFNADKMDDFTFSIYNISGQMVYQETTFSAWINIPLDLVSGVYVFNIKNTEGESVQAGKFIVQ